MSDARSSSARGYVASGLVLDESLSLVLVEITLVGVGLLVVA